MFSSRRNTWFTIAILCTIFWLLVALAVHSQVQQPPEKYRVLLHTYIVQEVEDADTECRKNNLPARGRILACTIKRSPPFLDLVITERACRFEHADHNAIYSSLMCHEAAHTGPDGWPSTHPEGDK